MVAQHSWCFVSVLNVSSKARARPRRWGRMEGKDYVMEDGDVTHSPLTSNLAGYEELDALVDYATKRGSRECPGGSARAFFRATVQAYTVSSLDNIAFSSRSITSASTRLASANFCQHS